MKLITSVALALFLLPCVASPAAASQKQSASADRLGLTCAQIRQMTSAKWVKKFTAARDTTEPSTIQAISICGKCLDSRTNHLAASVGKSGTGPLMGARGY